MRAALAIVALLLVLPLALQAVSSRSDVTVRNFALIDSPEVSPQAKREIAADIISRKYGRRYSDEIGERVRDALHRRGYFKALVYDPKITVVQQDPNGEIIDVKLTVEPGALYRLGDVVFTQAKVFPADELRRQIPMSAGDLFNVEKVREGIQRLRDLYCANGYLDMVPVPTPMWTMSTT